MGRVAVRIAIVGIVAMMMGVEKFSCKEKVEVGLMCDPTPEGPLRFGLTELIEVMKGANLIPKPIRPDAKKPIKGGTAELFGGVEARYMLVVGIAGQDKWLTPYLTAARLSVPAKPESFAYGEYRRKERRTVVIAGSDATGLMYGLLELADIIASGQIDPTKPLSKVSQSPAMEVRGVNLYLSLPLPREQEWWFHSEEFWRSYLRMLARARINFLDLHGMYDVVKATFPNVFPYFVKSDRFPEVGVTAQEAARNLAMLNKVVTLAKERGIRVGLMSYSTGTRTPGGAPPMRRETEEALAEYTRDAVTKILKACPELACIGFCIGDSVRKEDFYKKSLMPAIMKAGGNIRLYTRTWGATQKDIMELGRACDGRLDVEINFNGEHLGVPYIVAGGRMADWRDYSYQDYLCLPRSYRVIWQIRANGTHRIFRWGDPRFVKRTLSACALGGAAGFVVEPMNAYYPQRDYYHNPNVGHDFFTWIHERDWFWHMLWGRLAYDPDTPDTVWVTEFTRRFGERGGPRVYELLCEMSQIVPLIYQSHCLGPSHRQMACELETGGDVAAFAHGQPFDTFVMQSPAEFVTRQIIGKPTAKLSPLGAADLLERISKRVLQRIEIVRKDVQSGLKEFECIALDAEALAHLAQYYAEKLRAGVAYAFYEVTGDISQIDVCMERITRAQKAWQTLANVTARHYRPFLDILRMHSVAFHWSTEAKKLDKDIEKLEEARKQFLDSVPGPEEPILIAHVPPRRVLTGKPFNIVATIATHAKPVYAVLNYRQGETDFTSVRLRKTKTNEYVYETHIGSSWTPGKRLEYFIALNAGKKQAQYPPRGKMDPLSLLITDDTQGPSIRVEHNEREIGPGQKVLTVTARVADKGPIQKVLLWHKPLPSETNWRVMPMQAQGGVYTAQLLVKSEGLLFALEALDEAGNGTRFPDFRTERPYLVLEPWPGPPSPRQDDPTGLKELARRDLSPQRYAAMLIGAQAKHFGALSREGKKILLDRVSKGLPLVIFSQNIIKDFDFSWLPGNIDATTESYRVCKLHGTGALLDGVYRELKMPNLISAKLTGGEKDWKFYSDPKALAMYKHGDGIIILCQMRILELLHNIMTYRLFENILNVATGERTGKPFVIIDIGNGRLTQALEMADKPYVMLNELALLPAQVAPDMSEVPPKIPPAPKPIEKRPTR